MSWDKITDAEIAAYAPNTGTLHSRLRDHSCFRFHDCIAGPGVNWLSLNGVGSFTTFSTARMRFSQPMVNALQAGNDNLTLLVACAAEVTKQTTGSFEAEFRLYETGGAVSNVHSLSGADSDSPRTERFFLELALEVSRPGSLGGSTFRVNFQGREVTNAGGTYFGAGHETERYHSKTYGFQIQMSSPILLRANPR